MFTRCVEWIRKRKQQRAERHQRAREERQRESEERYDRARIHINKMFCGVDDQTARKMLELSKLLESSGKPPEKIGEIPLKDVADAAKAADPIEALNRLLIERGLGPLE